MVKLGGVFQATKTTYEPVCFWYASTFSWKKSWFSSVGSREPLKCHSEKVHEEIRFPSKPHWRHLVLLCEPKIKLPNKKLHKIPFFGANGSFELKHFRVFFVAQEFNTTHCHIVRCQRRETRFWEFPAFQSSLAKGRWWDMVKFPKTPIGLRTRSTIWDSYKNQPFPWDLGDVSFWVPYTHFHCLDKFAASQPLPEVPVHEETFKDKTGAIAMVPGWPRYTNWWHVFQQMTVLSSHVPVI